MNTYDLYEQVPDCSHWQGPINFVKMAAQRIKRVILKATQGVSFKDPAFETNRRGATAAGMGWTPYHYYEPAADPITQAAWFVSNVKDWDQVDDCPVADVESTIGIPAGYAGKLLLFLTEVERRTGLRPTIYTRSSYWKLYLYQAALWADSYRLMVAHYKDSLGPSVCAPWDPANWYIWQFTDRFNGPKYGTTSLQVDMSVVNGRVSKSWPAVKLDDLLYLSVVDQPRIRPAWTVADLLNEARMRLRVNLRVD